MKKFKKLVSASLLVLATFSTIFIGHVYADQQKREQLVQTKVVAVKVEPKLKESKPRVQTEKKIMVSTQSVEIESEEEYASLDEVIEQMNYNMDIGKICGLSKEDFVKLMQELPYDYIGFYERNAEFIWEMEQQYQVNAIFYCGIVAQESGWGQYGGSCNNYTGMMCSTGLIYYETEEAGIEATFKNIGKNYIPNGKNTVASIGITYAGDNSWADRVYSAMKMIVSD